MTKEQVEGKKQLLKQKLNELKSLKEELQAAGAWPLDDEELDGVAGGLYFAGLNPEPQGVGPIS